MNLLIPLLSIEAFALISTQKSNSSKIPQGVKFDAVFG